MKINWLLLFALLALNFSKGQAQENKTCELCLFKSMWFSDGSIVGMPKPGATDTFYPYQCKDGIWTNFSNDPCIQYFSQLRPDVKEEDKKLAKECEICLYGNESYGTGAIICMPKDAATPFTTYPHKCIQGKWIQQSNTNCK